MSVFITTIQMNSSPKVEENLVWLGHQFSQIKQQAASTSKTDDYQLVILPECFACFGGTDKDMLAIAEEYGNGAIQNFIAHHAKKYGLWIVAGSIPIKNTHSDLYSAASLLFSPDGQCHARYNKIHLFDANVADKTAHYRESATTLAGEDTVVIDTPFAKIGLAVCYDIRFPELFRQMQLLGAEIVCIPSAFTYVTGQAHWQVLLRARAIENQCFIAAPNQTGNHVNGRQTWGHSMLIDPWGEVIHQHAEQSGLIQSEINLAKIQQVKAKMPNLQHRKIK